MEVVAKAKKWGSSLGVVIPKDFVDRLGIRAEDKVIIDLKTPGKSDVLKKLFGKGKGKGERKTAQEWKDEFRRTLYKD
ncbi:hypothetical protein CMO88_03730 [Candidatus Woesearchaeota archaeon]|nr:hypothetical protein [Candidatus Woesearchaeota archaeon]|tara:strand:+ start:13436 stop:13669 length:234 start_codon:yes stop_codon:yes gene_type:complete